MSAANLAGAAPGTEGYAQDADALIRRYESVPFVAKHREILHLIPEQPSRILDIGAGTGADAAWFAERGHAVLAVEPTIAFVEAAIALHHSPRAPGNVHPSWARSARAPHVRGVGAGNDQACRTRRSE